MPKPPIQLHNTLTRSLEDFRPVTPDIATLYTCGPTVYNYAHIGNLRAFTFYDTLRRTLQANGFQVRHAMNITDVGHLVSDADEGEDKLETGAAREGKTVWQVADDYTQAFKHDMAALNILPPTENPGRAKNSPDDPYARATDFIPEQIEMIQRLIDKGYAYQTEQAIYFDVTKLSNYGELTGQRLADKEVAARSEVVSDPDKHHPYDFSVWFFTVGRYQGHTMHWDSPWGDGFPGWHLECSAIIHATLDGHTKSTTGRPIDIHTGGVDHIGTHHPNEMAQTEAAFDHALAHTWLHNEFILVDGAKMSKSLGNSYILKDITDKGFHPLALRFLYLQAHYRSEINFTWESIAAAQNALLNLYAWADLKYQTNLSEARLTEEAIAAFFARFDAALFSDLATPQALSELFQFTTLLAPGMTWDHIDFDHILEHLDNRLGLKLAGRPDITAAQRDIINEREAARTARDWPLADKLRTKLKRHQLDVSDTPNGPRWRRMTPTV